MSRQVFCYNWESLPRHSHVTHISTHRANKQKTWYRSWRLTYYAIYQGTSTPLAEHQDQGSQTWANCKIPLQLGGPWGCYLKDGMTNEQKNLSNCNSYNLRPPSSKYATEHLEQLYSIVCTSVTFMFPRRNRMPALRHHVKSCKTKTPGSLSLCNNMINLPSEIGIWSKPHPTKMKDQIWPELCSSLSFNYCYWNNFSLVSSTEEPI